MTTKQTEYALLAAGSYFDVRGGSLTVRDGVVVADTSNKAPLPDGWEVLTEFDIKGSGSGADEKYAGFSARVYKNKNTNEICISYAGTEFDTNNPGGVEADFIKANLPIAVGAAQTPVIKSDGSQQLYEAVNLYMQVRKKYGANANISFTGHSLGGGLAGVLGFVPLPSLLDWQREKSTRTTMSFWAMTQNPPCLHCWRCLKKLCYRCAKVDSCLRQS